VTGGYLGQLMADELSLQLAVLNACEGARAGAEDPFAGVAASLVKSEIPSVIAMQFEITDDAAILFAGGFYSALARGAPVDAALAAARKAIWANYNDIEWGTPVLFMRVPDGKIFDVAEAGRGEPERVDLALALSATPEVVDADDEVVWTLSIHNTGEAALSQVSALGPDGSVWLEPRALAPGQSVNCNWRSRASTDVEQVVTVSAVDPAGNKVSEQATGRVTVRPAQRAVDTPVIEETVPWWKRPRYLLPIAALVLVALVAGIVALAGGDGDDDGGNGGGGGGGEDPYAAAVLADDPVLYWRLDEEDGDTAADASDNGGDGRYEGVSLGEETFLPDGSAAGFDESSYVRGPAFDASSGPFTIELWAKNESAEDGVQHNIFSQGTDRGNAGLHLAFTPDRRFKCDFYNNPFRTVEAFPDGGWHHWACTYDPARDARRLYRDGRPVSAGIVEGGVTGPYTGEGDVFLGVPPWNGPGFIGLIDEVAVYPRVLSPEQLLAHYEERR
jgi:Concanavalin A-like lectin/glucanases superfamily/CHAT domain